MPKVTGNIVSIKSGTKKVIGRSDVSWSHVRPGSYFKIVGDPYIYDVYKTNQILHSFEFKIITPYQIQIIGDVDPILMNGDTILLLYNEYRLFTIMKIIDGGANYKEDDILNVEDGTLSINIQDNTTEKTQFRVANIGEKGEVLSFALHKAGRYFVKPNRLCKLSGGSGYGVMVELEFIPNENRQKIERVIRHIEYDIADKSTIVHLEYPLPSIKDGILSINKWEMILTSEYLSATVRNAKCEIITDFTSHLNLPLMLSRSVDYDSIYNRSMVKLDNDVRLLKEKLQQLEDTLSALNK